MCMHLCLCGCLASECSVWRGQKWTSDSLRPGLEKVVSCLMWVLEAEVWSSIRVGSAFNHRAISPSLKRPEIFLLEKWFVWLDVYSCSIRHTRKLRSWLGTERRNYGIFWLPCLRSWVARVERTLKLAFFMTTLWLKVQKAEHFPSYLLSVWLR